MNNDIISREAAIAAADYTDYRGLAVEDVKAVTDEVVKELKKLPSAETERKRGHWIEITSSNHTYKCSVCGRLLVNITDGKNNVAKNYPYCHCGADMKNKENE